MRANSSELTCLVLSLPFIKEQGMFILGRLPNAFNFELAYYTMCLIGMALYVPIFPQLYLYMFGQRKKYLSKLKASKAFKEFKMKKTA